MLSLTDQQKAILADDAKSDGSWLFTIIENGNTHYWARKVKTYGGNAHTFRVIDFTPIQMGGSGAESGVIVPSGTTITLTSPDTDPLDPADYEGADVTISEVFKAGGVEDEIRSFGLEAVNAYQLNQTLKLESKDWFYKYLKGVWPNTPLIQDLFPSDLVNEANDNVCVPVIFGTAFIPVRPAYKTDAVYYILGPDAPTYTITKIKTPKDWPSKDEWLNSGYDLDNSGSFYTLTGSDGNDYKATRWIICADDAAGDFPIGGKFLDVPCNYSRNDTSSMTNPANVIEYILEDFGVPSAKIDATAQAAAAAIFAGWGLTWNGGFWYQRDRMKVLSELLIQCHMRLIVRDKIYMKVLSKTSQKTLDKSYTKASVSNNQIIDQYTVTRIGAEDRKDSGYVAYCGTDDCQDVLHKILVPAKGSATDHISNDCFNMPLVHDSQHVQKLGTLAYQRKFCRHSRCTQVWKETVQELEVCDVITISPTDYDGSFDAEIKTMSINPDASVKTEFVRYTVALDDWGDLSPGAISPATDDTANPYSIMVSGPDSTGKTINKVKGRFWVGDTILLDSAGDGKIHVGTGLSNDVAFNVHDKAYWDGSKFVIDGMVTAIEGAIGGLTLADGYLYGLASGTPTDTPSDGIVIASGNPGVIVYENTQKRVELGYLSAGVYGQKIYDDDGSTVLFEISDTQKVMGGWTVSTTGLANSTNIILNSSDKSISINDATYGNAGIQLQYNAGTPRIYIGDSSDAYVQYDGTKVQIKAANFELDASGNIIASSATLSGAITATTGAIGGWDVVSGYLYNLASGTPTSTPSDGIVLASGNPGVIVYENTEKRVEVGYLSSGVYGLKAYDDDGSTVLFEVSDTQKLLAGWTVSSSTLANSTNIILDASNKKISINSATFGNDGIQLDYNAGNPRAYIGDGANQYIQFDGTDLSWKGTNTELTAAGQLSVSNILATGGTVGGWTIASGKLSITGLELDQANNRFRAFTGDNYVDITAGGLTGYDSVLGTVFRIFTDGSAPEFSSGVIKECTHELYTSGVFKTAVDPSATGGLIINNTSITGYNTSGDIRFQSIFSGANQGDLLIGDYAGDKGCFYDQSAGTFSIRGALNADDLAAGTITSRTLQTAASGARTVISQADGETHIYADIGGGDVQEAITLGVSLIGSDYILGNFGNTDSWRTGVKGTSKSYYGVWGVSVNGVGVLGEGYSSGVYGYSSAGNGTDGSSVSGYGAVGISTNGRGVHGSSTNGYGGYFLGPSVGPICLYPSSSASAPSHSADKGTLWVTSAGLLYINTNGSTTWAKVGAQ